MTAPTVRPTALIAVVAAACVRLTTLGTVTLEITGVPVTTQVNAGASNGTVRSWRMVMTSALVTVELAARLPRATEPLTMTVAGELLVTLTAAAVSAGVPFCTTTRYEKSNVVRPVRTELTNCVPVTLAAATASRCGTKSPTHPTRAKTKP